MDGGLQPLEGKQKSGEVCLFGEKTRGSQAVRTASRTVSNGRNGSGEEEPVRGAAAKHV